MGKWAVSVRYGQRAPRTTVSFRSRPAPKALFPAQRFAFRSPLLAALPGVDIMNHWDIIRFAGYSALPPAFGLRQSDLTQSC